MRKIIMIGCGIFAVLAIASCVEQRDSNVLEPSDAEPQPTVSASAPAVASVSTSAEKLFSEMPSNTVTSTQK